jgi:hypothetical protein
LSFATKQLTRSKLLIQKMTVAQLVQTAHTVPKPTRTLNQNTSWATQIPRWTSTSTTSSQLRLSFTSALQISPTKSVLIYNFLCMLHASPTSWSLFGEVWGLYPPSSQFFSLCTLFSNIQLLNFEKQHYQATCCIGDI